MSGGGRDSDGHGNGGCAGGCTNQSCGSGGGGRVRRACADDEGLLMTRASARGTGIWDGFSGGETPQGAGLCRKSRVFFFWNQSECRGLSLSGKFI